MPTLTRYTRTSILLLIVVYAAFGADLTDKQRSKLHPLFRSLITKSSQPLLKTSSRLNRIASTVSSDGTLRYGAIVYTRDVEEIRSMGIHVNSVLPEFVTAQLTPSDMVRLADLESVKFLDPGKVHHPLLDVSVPETGATLLHSGFINNTPYKGAGAIVLIYDTGIDWKHFDFRKSDTTKSRILFIWDQTLTAGIGESAPSGFSYGVEYTQTQIENELNGTKRGVVREKDIEGHGTHVTSTAAGNGFSFNNKYVGMAPEADIIVVKGGDGTFSSTGEIDGLTYAQNKAGGKPIVVNMSLGGQIGSHDGTNDDEVAVDNFVKNAGRVVCIAAGNDGGNNIHINGTIANGSPAVITVTVPTYTQNPGTANDEFILDIWLPDSNAVNLSVKSPTNSIYSTSTDSSIDGLNRPEGTIDTWNHIEQQNQHSHIQVWIHDAASPVPQSGQWTITLNTTGGSIAYDAWLDSELGDGSASASLVGGNTNKTVAMPGTASGAITVGAYVSKWYWYSYDNTGPWNYGTDRTGNIANFSSIGPTADGQQKPDITAPGQMIVAALSSDVDTTGSASDIVLGQKHQVMMGTSMATPHVTGGTALLLGANPLLTAAQIKSLCTSTANSDSYATGLPNYIWGCGKFDVLEAMAKSIWSSASVVRTTLAYDGTTTSKFVRVTGTQKAAVRFSPTTSGTLTGIQVYITSLPNRPIAGSGPLVCDVYTDNAGFPGTKIGSSVSQPFSLLSPFTNNYIQMTTANVNVTSGTAYYAVLSIANTTDSVLVRYEDVTTGTRSLLFNGSSWSAQIYNLRIRSIVTTTSGLTGVDGSLALQPQEYRLMQNYPNPFNPTTKIAYTIPVASKVTLKIFNLLGQLVATLVDEQQEANTYVKEFDASRLASGTYFYQINAGNFNSTKKMTLMK
ncbi:MAG: S8/S53 family peptidase [Bacteroidota bacterium]